MSEGRLVCFFSVGVKPFKLRYWERDRHADALFALQAAAELRPEEFQGQEVLLVPILTPETAAEARFKEPVEEAIRKATRNLKWDEIVVAGAGPGDVRTVIEAMLAKVRNGDRVRVDPTNGLRSLAVGMIAGALLLRALRDDITVERLLYGQLVETPPVSNGPDAAPRDGRIHDVSEVLTMFDWARDAHTMAEALNPEPIVRRVYASRGLSDNAKKLQVALSTGHVPALAASLRGGLPLRALPADGEVARDALDLVRRRLHPLMQKAGETKADLLDPAWLEMELAFCEALDGRGRLSSALMILREWCVNTVLLAMSTGPEWNTRKGRAVAEAWLGARGGRRPNQAPPPYIELCALAAQAQDFRNQLMHAGYQGPEKHMPADLSKWRKPIGRARAWWDAIKATGLPPLAQETPAPSVFLNLSNHASMGWQQAQTMACLATGAEHIVDQPFPDVDPEAGPDVLVQQADDLLASIDPSVGWALVQGETILALHLVARLQRRGVTCFVATTRRLVQNLPDGKLSRFEFQRLRAWPVLSLQESA